MNPLGFIRTLFGPRTVPEYLRDTSSVLDGFTVTSGESVAKHHRVGGFVFQFNPPPGVRSGTVHYEVTCAKCKSGFAFSSELRFATEGRRGFDITCPTCKIPTWMGMSISTGTLGSPFWALNIDTIDSKLRAATTVVIRRIERGTHGSSTAPPSPPSPENKAP